MFLEIFLSHFKSQIFQQIHWVLGLTWARNRVHSLPKVLKSEYNVGFSSFCRLKAISIIATSLFNLMHQKRDNFIAFYDSTFTTQAINS